MFFAFRHLLWSILPSAVVVPEIEESAAQLLLQIMTFTSQCRISGFQAPQNLEKGKEKLELREGKGKDGIVDGEILWNQGKKEEMSFE